MRKSTVGLLIYFGFLLLPLYWLVLMSLKTNEEILGGITFWPETITFANYSEIFTNPDW